MICVAEETISRWRQQEQFRALMRRLLQEHVDSVRLGMISLTTEAITQLRYLINGFSHQTSLRACAVVLGTAAPVISAIGAELRRPPE